MTDTGIKIDSGAWYDDSALYDALEISYRALSRARRTGELRYTRKGTRTLYLGQWIITWLTGSNEQEEVSHRAS